MAKVMLVEDDVALRDIYSARFKNDNIYIFDAHEFLLKHYPYYDLIWSSPPCQSHSSFRQNIGVRYRWVKAIYPDMKLWQEIIFLQANCKWKYVVENVKP